MSQKTREKNKNSAPNRERRCSLCRELNHTKRDCLKRPVILKNATPSGGAPIAIRVNTGAIASRHLLNASQKLLSQKWEKQIPVFEEDRNFSKERKVVDFAAIVRREVSARQLEESAETEEDGYDDTKEDDEVVEIDPAPRKIVAQKPWKKNNFSFRFFAVKKFAYGALALLALASLPLPAIGYYRQIKTDTARIVEESANAFLSLQSSTVAAFSNNLSQAQFDLNAALNSFSRAEDLIDKEYRALVYVASLLPVVGKEVSGRQHLLLAGHQLALGNTYLVKGLNDASKTPDIYFVDRMEIMRHHIEGALPQYEEALRQLEQVDSAVLPAEYQSSFKDFKLLFAVLLNDLQSTKVVLSGLESILGDEGFKRYLVVFQNNHELRASGGFMGSFAVVDIQKGKILNIDVPGGGSYDLQGQLDTYLRPPLPLQIANSRWEFQDANWFPDWAASAEKIAWFYQHGRKTTVDGVIAINASVLERVLRVLGPVASEKYNLILDPERALSILQQHIEEDYDKSVNQPKAVIGDVLAQLMDSVRTIKPEQMISLVGELQGALEEKEIQFYFFDKSAQKKFRQFGWTGEIKKTAPDQDYLMVVNTNLGGQKSDAVMGQEIEHESAVQEDGSVIDTVIIKKTHSGDADEKFYGARNIDYLRVYAPEGSELLDAGGFVYPEEQEFLAPEDWYKEDETLKSIEREIGMDVKTGTRITKEFGKTVFANWIVTGPGSASEVWFRYKIPLNVMNAKFVETAGNARWNNIKKMATGDVRNFSRYSLFVQKQSGMESGFSTQVIYPSGWRPIWKTEEKINLKLNGAEYHADLKTDFVLGIAMEKNGITN